MPVPAVALLRRDFIGNSLHTFQMLSRVPHMSEQDLNMTKLDMTRFQIGDVVSTDDGKAGIVRTIFTTVDGEPRYAVENEGALEFICESRLSPRPKAHLAA